jgi:hypothetical protein
MKTEQKELTFIKIEAKGFQDLCNRLAELEQENQSLKIDNDFLQKQNAACKLRCGKFAIKVRELESEIADMKFTHKMLNSEEAGRAFARELLGKPMTREELAIEAAENAYEPYTGDDF